MLFPILDGSQDSSSPRGGSVQHHHVCRAKFASDSGDAKGEPQSDGGAEMSCCKKISGCGREEKDASSVSAVVREPLQMKMTRLGKLRVVLQMKAQPGFKRVSLQCQQSAHFCWSGHW